MSGVNTVLWFLWLWKENVQSIVRYRDIYFPFDTYNNYLIKKNTNKNALGEQLQLGFGGELQREPKGEFFRELWLSYFGFCGFEK